MSNQDLSHDFDGTGFVFFARTGLQSLSFRHSALWLRIARNHARIWSVANAMCRRTIWLLLVTIALTFMVACSSSNDSSNGRSVASNPPDETEGCSALPLEKLFPIIGAFLGPAPGPCALTAAGEHYVFHYDSNAVIVSQISDDQTDTTEFVHEQELLVNEIRTQPSGVTKTVYEYASNAIETIATHPDNTTIAYQYQLDDRGYIRTARLLNAVRSSSIPTHFSYEYLNCAIQWRIAYDQNDAVNLEATAEYSYDEHGQLSMRASQTSEELFDYSCW